MFIVTMKANTIKFFAVIILALAAVIAIIFTTSGAGIITTSAIAEANEKINYNKIKTNDDRIDFLAQFGWSVESEPTEEVSVKIPREFDKIMTSYNEVQKSMGLDLSKYAGHEVTRYTYKITNYPDYDGTVYASIIIYKNRVIGGDISSSDVSGFIHSLRSPK